MTASVFVFGIGNRSRGDDALGPLLLDRLRDWLEGQGLAAGFELFEEYQLQVENALDQPSLPKRRARAAPIPLEAPMMSARGEGSSWVDETIRGFFVGKFGLRFDRC